MTDLIALRAQESVFKVRKDILSRGSAVFDDMLSIPQPDDAVPVADSDLHEGIPVVPMQDSAADLQLFLSALHNEMYAAVRT